MTNDQLQLVRELTEILPNLTGGQLHWIRRAASVFSQPYTLQSGNQGWFDDETLRNFGEAMRVHHCFSVEPFSKDKFEYVLVAVLRVSGVDAHLAPKGNPGHDATIDGVRVSLKTQADKNIRANMLWISKFMELGKGSWGHDPADLIGLRDHFLNHMKGYERILVLRALSKAPDWHYELVEIPKTVLEEAKSGEFEMKLESKQKDPKPGYCYVPNKQHRDFSLYFDGGRENKLQIKSLQKKRCLVHAVWRFHVPEG